MLKMSVKAEQEITNAKLDIKLIYVISVSIVMLKLLIITVLNVLQLPC
jgi:hypothetical protein